jgi:hypothetical protein
MDGGLDTADGARICNGLGILRTCLETRKLLELEERMSEINARLNGRIINARPATLSSDKLPEQRLNVLPALKSEVSDAEKANEDGSPYRAMAR